MDSPKRFEPRFSVNFRQVVAIVIVIGIITLIPLAISYIGNPDRKSPREMYENVIETLRPDAMTTEDQLVVEVPLTNLRVDLTVVKENPQIAIFGGVAFLIVALIIFVSLVRNVLR